MSPRELAVRYGFLVLFAALVIYFALAAPGFVSPQSAVFVFQSVAITGVLALGVTATLVVGGFDLSIGSVATSSMMAAAYAMVVLDQGVFVHVQLDHVIQLAATAGQDRIERFGLGRSARITIEDSPGAGAHGIKLVTDQRRDDLVRDQLARFHHGLGLEANRRPGLDGGAQHVARGKLLEAMTFDQALGLRALAGTRRAEKNDIHFDSPPLRHLRDQRSRPFSLAFLIRSPYWCASRCDWIWVIVSTVTLTTISKLVPPKNSVPIPVSDMIHSGMTQTKVI